MSPSSSTVRVLLLSALLAAGSGPALAQSLETAPVPRFDVSAGYTFLRDFSIGGDSVNGIILPDNVDLPAGWVFSGAFNPTQWFGIVGEANASYRNGLEIPVDGYSFSNKVRIYTFMAGPRFFHKTGRFVPYAQVLAGISHLRLTTAIPANFPYGSFGPLTATSDDFTFQPGGGVTVYLTERIGMRAGADYRCIVNFDDDDDVSYANELRLVAGFTLQWGAR
jgi:hypothetical protein